MKRAVLCVPDPHNYMPQVMDHSIMIMDPRASSARKTWLLQQADWSVLITEQGVQSRSGGYYPNERVLWYTSGTVGDSKFYSFTAQQVHDLATSMVQDLEITANDRYVGVMPLWHAHGQSLYWATKLAGCESHFLGIDQIRSLWALNPTFVSAVPGILKLLLRGDLPDLRFIRSGSAPLHHQLYDMLQQRFRVPVVEYFGMTEAMSHVLTNPLHGPQRSGTVGMPTKGVQAKIQNDTLWIHSTRAYTTQWFDTGDLAQQDQHGYFKILGRQVDRINVHGYKLDPVSLEQQILRMLPTVSDIVCFGDTSVKCLYVGTSNPQQVCDAMTSMHASCRPTWIQQVDQIPHGPNGKISRVWLAQKFAS